MYYRFDNIRARDLKAGDRIFFLSSTYDTQRVDEVRVEQPLPAAGVNERRLKLAIAVMGPPGDEVRFLMEPDAMVQRMVRLYDPPVAAASPP